MTDSDDEDTHGAFVASGVVTTSVVVADRLSKRFGNLIALDGLDLAVTRGEVFGYLGPNGAGKTTTIRLLLDALRPTDGNVVVLGRAPA